MVIIMKKVFIKYNPYKLQTHITVDGKNLAQNSELQDRIIDGTRLQEWVEDLPRILREEYNDTDFDVVFHGTLMDYEDLTDVFTQAYNRKELTAKLDHKPAIETSDKELLIDRVFEEILNGPFEELRDEEIKVAFENAKSKDFEVCVVATMSAGKSTLINAMLRCKLMPSKQEACTATITRVKDITQEKIPFKAEVYHGDKPIEIYEELTYPIMERLNSDENVSEIRAFGNIPFVSSDDVSLVLIDTPGPNNARDKRHKAVQSNALGKSSKTLVLYIMTGEFGTDDDYTVLKRVSDSMSVGGKQSKDRFIFVVNKMDDRRKEDGDTEQTLERVRTYLKTHGIKNPNLFPAAALPALNIRLMENGYELDEDTQDETKVKVKKLNRNKMLHFETYAALPPSACSHIGEQLMETRTQWTNMGGCENENPREVLIHTGIVSIESAIRQYVQKYAKTAKIKNIVDTFLHKMDELDCIERTKQELARHCEKSEEIVNEIKKVRNKIDSALEAKQFEGKVNDSVIKISNESKNIIDKIILEFEKRLQQKKIEQRNIKFTLSEADAEMESLSRFTHKIELEFKEQLNDLIQSSLIKTGNTLLTEYKKKLAVLASEINIDGMDSVKIEPLKMLGGSIAPENFSTQLFIKEEEVEDGEEWIENTDKAWYKPWTWFQESGYYSKKYKKIKYVNGSELAQEFFRPIERILRDNGENAHKYAVKQSKKIAERFNQEFTRLDDLLKAKLAECENYATDKEKADARIKDTEEKLLWLKNIQSKVNSILEI